MYVSLRKVLNSKYYSISVDSTPDILHVDHLTFIVRSVFDNGDLVERFIKCIRVLDHTPKEIKKLIIDKLFELYINYSNNNILLAIQKKKSHLSCKII